MDFTSNPASIKAAKLAIMNNLNVNTQQDGICLYATMPKMTRARREELARTAETKLYNEYRLALNEVLFLPSIS